VTLAVERVAVNGECVGEVVVLPVLLVLAERLVDDGGVEETDGRRRFAVLAQLPRLGVGTRGVALLLDVAHAVGGQRGVDVPLDVERLGLDGVGVHLEALHDRRVDPTDHDGGDDHQRQAHDGKAPHAADRGDHEEHGHDHSDAGEDRLAGHHGIHRGVAGTGELLSVGEQQRIAVEPQADGAEDRQQGRQRRDLHPRRPRDREPWCEGDGAVKVVHGGRRDEGGGDGPHQRGEHQPEERKGEHEESDVEPEVGITHVEGDPVEPQQHRPPLARERCAHEEPGEAHDREEYHPAERGELLPVHLEIAIRGADRHVRAPGPIGEKGVEPDGDAHQQESEREQRGTYQPLGPEDTCVTQLREPEHIGPDFRQRDHDPGEDEEDHHRGPEGPAPSRQSSSGWRPRCPGPLGRREIGVSHEAPPVSQGPITSLTHFDAM